LLFPVRLHVDVLVALVFLPQISSLVARPVTGLFQTAKHFWLRPCSTARRNLPRITASGLRLVVDGNIKNWPPFETGAFFDDAGLPHAAPIGEPYLVAFFHSFVSCLSARIAPQASVAGRVAQAARMALQ
jgi:hypothetical protein